MARKGARNILQRFRVSGAVSPPGRWLACWFFQETTAESSIRDGMGRRKGFERLPRRWVVECTIAWLNRNRRLAKDFEASIESAVAWIFIASVKLLSKRVART
jgi:transposase